MAMFILVHLREVRIVSTVTLEQILNTKSRLRLPRILEQGLDAGAQVTVLNLNTNAKLYYPVSHDHVWLTVLSSEIGDTINIDASGVEKKLLENSYVSDVETGLVSGPNIKKSDH